MLNQDFNTSKVHYRSLPVGVFIEELRIKSQFFANFFIFGLQRVKTVSYNDRTRELIRSHHVALACQFCKMV